MVCICIIYISIYLILVSPRWALASYSCILGKFDWTSEVEKTLNWYLQVNGSNYDDENESTELQQVNVVRIFKYPQVILGKKKK